MTGVLQDITAKTALQAIGANKRELIGSFRLVPGAGTYDGPDLAWAITSLPCPLFNSVLCARLSSEHVSGAISAAVARARIREVPFLWWVAPDDRPADLGARLVDHGLVHVGSVEAMALDLREARDSAPPPPDISLERVADSATVKSCAGIVAECFGFPPEVRGAWQDYCVQASRELADEMITFVARQRGVPVATAVLYFACGVAGIYNVATVPEARRQGIGTALVQAACADAHDRGYRAAVLEASDMGAGVYEEIGFRRYGQVTIFVWTPPPDADG